MVPGWWQDGKGAAMRVAAYFTGRGRYSATGQLVREAQSAVPDVMIRRTPRARCELNKLCTLKLNGRDNATDEMGRSMV